MDKDSEQETAIYNPTLEDISTDIDKFGDNPKQFTLKAGDVKSFPKYVADILGEKLIEKMYWANVPSNRDSEGRRKELRKVIFV